MRRYAALGVCAGIWINGGTAIAQPAAPASWASEVLDFDVNGWSAPMIFARPSGITILASAGPAVMWLRASAHGWTREQAASSTVAAAAFGADDVPWVVVGNSAAGTVELTHGAKTETVSTDYEKYMVTATVALDASGTPHVCLATRSRDNTRDTLSHLARSRGKWVPEVIPGDASRCELVFGTDGSIYVGTDTGVAVRAGGAWRLDALGGRTKVRRAADGTIVAVIERDHNLDVARLRDGAWKRETLVSDLGEIRSFAIAVDSHGLAHAAVEIVANPISELRYVVEGKRGSERIIGADARSGLDMALDASDAPHIVYGRNWTDKATADTLELAQRRQPGDRALLARDEDGIIAACGALVADELGAEPVSDVAARQSKRLCEDLHRKSMALDELAKRCTAGSVDACLVAGALVSDHSHGALQRMELRRDICEHKNERCWTTKTQVAEIGSFLPRLDADAARANGFFDQACALGSSVACFYAAWSPDVALAPMATSCRAGVALACAVALTKPEVVRDATLLHDMRALLERACKTSARPTACVTLAYLQESGLGGPARPADALRSHLHACALASPTSCIRLLVGPLGRPAAPKELDADALEALLAEQCDNDHDGDDCLAYAAAHERGWGMPKDKDGAAAILHKACEEQGLAKACKKLGRK